ncbi:MAG: lytic transglycosylase domain-containing protein [Thermodesulfobacteriota bacterium]
MTDRAHVRLLKAALTHPVLVSGVLVCCSTGLGLTAALGILKLHRSFSNEVVLRPSPAPWAGELRLAQWTESQKADGPQDPWGIDEIRWFVTASFKGLSPSEKRELASVIYEECKTSRLAPQLVLSLIAVESEGVPTSVSPKGAMGLMQLDPSVAKALAADAKLPWEGDHSLYRPGLNVRLGIEYLLQMLLRYQDLSLALSAYYLGPNRLDRLLSKDEGLPWHYVGRVMRLYEAF